MQHDDYYNALERLRTNKPEVLSKGAYKINYNTVAIEAGRGEGAIKRSREEFKGLRKAIDTAGKEFNNKALNKLKKAEALAARYKLERDDFKSDYHAALNREVMLVKRLSDLEKQINQLEAEIKVVHIKS